jgi:hypothetical protein
MTADAGVIPDELIAEVIAGCEGVTDGPWWPEPEYDETECGCSIIAATEHGELPGNPTRGQVAFVTELLPSKARRAVANAAHIARLDKQTVLAAFTELQRRRKAEAGRADLVEREAAARAIEKERDRWTATAPYGAGRASGFNKAIEVLRALPASPIQPSAGQSQDGER